jgi:hypothetical protein
MRACSTVVFSSVSYPAHPHQPVSGVAGEIALKQGLTAIMREQAAEKPLPDPALS